MGNYPGGELSEYAFKQREKLSFQESGLLRWSHARGVSILATPITYTRSLGQWSDVGAMFAPTDFPCVRTLITHYDSPNVYTVWLPVQSIYWYSWLPLSLSKSVSIHWTIHTLTHSLTHCSGGEKGYLCYRRTRWHLLTCDWRVRTRKRESTVYHFCYHFHVLFAPWFAHVLAHIVTSGDDVRLININTSKIVIYIPGKVKGI